MKRILSIVLLAVASNAFAQWQPPAAADGDPITHTGNVAIGTTTPQTDSQYPLKIFGSGAHKGVRLQTTTDHAAFFETSSNAVCTTRLQSNSASGFAGTMTNHPFLFVVNSTERARVDTTGYFGVGTTTPMSSIHQYTNTSANPITAALSGAGGWDGLLTLNAGALGQAGGGGGIVFGGFQPSQYFGAVKALLTNGAGNTTGDLAFSTRNATADAALTERMRIVGDGKVAFGSFAAPISSLQQYTNTSANPTTAALTGPGGWDGLLTLNAGSIGQAGGGGGIVFGGNQPWQYFGSIKALLTNGAVNTAGDIAFSTRGTVNDSSLTERMRILAAGNVGIGTSAPTAASALTVGAPVDARLDVVSQTSGYATVRLVSNNAVYASIDSMDATYATPKNLLLQPNGGQLAVGAQVAGHSAEKLVVLGDAYFTGTVKGGNIQAQYQDLAEWVPASEDLAPGTVVIVDSEARNTVSASTTAYDTRVAGVVSAQPGIVLGVEGRSKAKIATTGRVKVRADATRNPIHAGDLLVSGEKPGTAIRSEPMEINGRRFHQPGTIIGKALEPLANGEGEILVLLSLQ